MYGSVNTADLAYSRSSIIRSPQVEPDRRKLTSHSERRRTKCSNKLRQVSCKGSSAMSSLSWVERPTRRRWQLVTELRAGNMCVLVTYAICVHMAGTDSTTQPIKSTDCSAVIASFRPHLCVSDRR